MKIRVRFVDGGETLRLDLPPNCSLQYLKDTIAGNISSNPPLIHLSLNKKDELQGFPQQPLQTLGIAGGDLIFYTLSADGFQLVDNVENPKRGREEEQNPNSMRELCASAALKRASNGKVSSSGDSGETCVNDSKIDDDSQVGVEIMEVDDEQLTLPEKSRSVPFFLERVLLAEKENTESGHGLLVMAVHAVMLELGFVGFDLKTSVDSGFVGFDGFRLPEGWATKAMVSLYYTLPELVNGDGKCEESVCLRFQMLGGFLVVYGSLVNAKGSQVYRLSLEVEFFLSALHFALNSVEVICNGENSANSLFTEGIKQNENTEKFSLNMRESKQGETVPRGSSSRHKMRVKGSSSSHEMGAEASSSLEMCVFELWRIVKDRLSMPVLTALCEKTGLPSPPSLILLPTELKLKILEFLHAVDVAKLGCVCTEFRFLSVNDELWKKKYAGEFGSPSEVERPAEGRPGAQRWKDAFAMAWRKRMEVQRRNFMNRSYRQTPRVRLPRYMPVVPFPAPGFGISGGDYDRFPAIGGGGFFPGGGMLGSSGRRLWSTGRRHGVTSCDFSGLRGDSLELPDE